MAEQEVKPCKFENGVCIHCEAAEREDCEGWICPPQRPWVGLTTEEIMEIIGVKSSDSDWNVIGVHKWIRATEAKLKGKNYD